MQFEGGGGGRCGVKRGRTEPPRPRWPCRPVEGLASVSSKKQDSHGSILRRRGSHDKGSLWL